MSTEAEERLQSLTAHLDSLIIAYLNLFDVYQSLQADISKHLSNGFLSLAQANFNAPNRVRYGQDCYDQRMTALRGVSISGSDEKPSLEVKDMTTTESSEFTKKEEAGSSGLRNRKPKKVGTEKTANLDREEEEEEAPRVKIHPKDPIRWFGILSPPALKTSQKEFIESLPLLLKLCGVIKEIEASENEVRKVRAKVREMRVELGVDVKAPVMIAGEI